MYYPKGKTDDDFCLLKIKAKRMRLYRNLSVAELRGDGSPNDGSPNDGSQA
jgi:general stress protein 26